MGLVDDLISQFQAQQERANAANEQRFQQGMELFDRIIEQNKPGGTFEKATEAQIGRAGKKSVASGMQALVSSGLAGTSQAAGLQKKFEEEVGQPSRLAAADVSAQRLSEARVGKAGFIERREDIGPSFSDIAGLAKSIGAGQQSTQSGIGGLSSSSFGGFGGRGGGGGGGGRSLSDWIFSEGAKISAAFDKRVSRPMTSAQGGRKTPGQGRGTFIMGPPAPKTPVKKKKLPSYSPKSATPAGMDQPKIGILPNLSTQFA